MSDATMCWLLLGGSVVLAPLFLLAGAWLCLQKPPRAWRWWMLGAACALVVLGLLAAESGVEPFDDLRISARDTAIEQDNREAAAVLFALSNANERYYFLLWAAIKNRSALVQYALEWGVSPDPPGVDNNTTPMECAIVNHDMDLARTLLGAGANPDQPGSQRWTAMHMAAYHGWTYPLKMLQEAGAHLDLQDGDGNTPLHLAAEENQPELAAWLLEHGASLSIANAHGQLARDVATGEARLAFERFFAGKAGATR